MYHSRQEETKKPQIKKVVKDDYIKILNFKIKKKMLKYILIGGGAFIVLLIIILIASAPRRMPMPMYY